MKSRTKVSLSQSYFIPTTLISKEGGGGTSAINKVNEPEHDSPIFTMPAAGCQNKEAGGEGSFLCSSSLPRSYRVLERQYFGINVLGMNSLCKSHTFIFSLIQSRSRNGSSNSYIMSVVHHHPLRGYLLSSHQHVVLKSAEFIHMFTYQTLY